MKNLICFGPKHFYVYDVYANECFIVCALQWNLTTIYSQTTPTFLEKKIATLSPAMLEGKIETNLKTMINNGLAKLLLHTSLSFRCAHQRAQGLVVSPIAPGWAWHDPGRQKPARHLLQGTVRPRRRPRALHVGEEVRHLPLGALWR
jgi:hypothetical protein